jgi:enoyl-CoA hydratase
MQFPSSIVMEYKKIKLVISENSEIATVSLNRPEKLNAIDMQTIEELEYAFRVDLIRTLPKVVILTGQGNVLHQD